MGPRPPSTPKGSSPSSETGYATLDATGWLAGVLIINAYRNWEFVFNCDYKFTDRFSGQADYFQASEKGIRRSEGRRESGATWETNFVPDVRTVGNMRFSMASWHGMHASEYPIGSYDSKAHYHRPGATIVGLAGEGYGLLWHRKYGIPPSRMDTPTR